MTPAKWHANGFFDRISALRELQSILHWSLVADFLSSALIPD